MQSLLGATCSVRLCSVGSAAGRPSGVAQGVLFEVRRLWLPADPTDRAGTSTQQGPLYAFVRMKDGDHRLSGWFPLSAVDVRDSETGELTPMAMLVRSPLLSSVYREVTAGMGRTQRAMKLLDYLEERLLRDGRTPTTIRFFVYLNEFIFAPWYYSPYGLLHPAYDPLASVPVAGTPLASSTALPPCEPNPYIRDAFLCPFSLRVYTTAEQMRYETRTYRRGRLRPPGTEIFRDAQRGYSLFEVNGSVHVTYGRHLFTLGKSFLENKLAGHDVHNYYFYVMCLHHRYFPEYVDDPDAMYFAGYFTWEKQVADCNLACIVALPCFTGGGSGSGPGAGGPVPKGIGQFMIAASYELAYRRRQVGSPEKPLSDLGAAAYNKYWRGCLTEWMYRTAQALRPWQQHGGDSTAALMEEGSTGPFGVKRSRSGGLLSPLKDMLPPSAERVIDVDADEQEDGNGTVGPTEEVTTIRRIAEQVGLEDTDVLKTLLSMGLLHRCAEDRSCRLVVPCGYAAWEHRRLQGDQHNLQIAVFNPALLQTKAKARKS